jgi:hypothetical protein
MNEAEIKQQLSRWRLVLGQEAQEKLDGMGDCGLNKEEARMDRALSALYGWNEVPSEPGSSAKKDAGLGPGYPNLALWLTDIRKVFSGDLVRVLQKDAIERKGLAQLLLEPESLAEVEPDMTMASIILSLKDQIPAKSKEQARALIQALVKKLMERMENDLKRSVTGALNRRKRSNFPKLANLDWNRTIRKNLKNYDVERKKLIAEHLVFYESQKSNGNWRIILDLDQSGSMFDSIVYSSIMACIFASIPSIDTRVVAFDEKVVDLTEIAKVDPVDVLYGIQLGGGTDINQSVVYCTKMVENPKKTLFILISDLYEGGVEAGLLARLQALKDLGVLVLVLLALTDEGMPSYNAPLGRRISALGIPCFACSPDNLPELVGGAIKGLDLMELMKRVKI